MICFLKTTVANWSSLGGMFGVERVVDEMELHLHARVVDIIGCRHVNTCWHIRNIHEQLHNVPIGHTV